MFAHDSEQVLILVLLQGLLPACHLTGFTLVETEGAALVGIDADVELSYVDMVNDGCIFLNCSFHLGRSRAEDVVVALHTDTVYRNAGSFHPGDEAYDTVALAGVALIVVVVEQKCVRVCLVSILECLVDEFLTCDLVHRRVAELGLAGPYRAVGYCLIDNVPCINDVFVTLYDCLDVMFHVGVKLFLGKKVALLVLIDPSADL